MAAFHPPLAIAPPPAAVAPPVALDSLLAQVPADTPYVFANLDAVDDVVLARFRHQFETQLAKAAAGDSGFAREIASVSRILQAAKQGHDTWTSALGLAPSGRFVFYGESIWPVLRIEVSDPARLHAFIASALAALRPQIGPVVEAASGGGQLYWLIDLGSVQLEIAVLPHEAVIAVMPVIANEPLAQHPLWNAPVSFNLAANRTLEIVRKAHGFNKSFVGYIDVAQLVAVVTGRRPHDVDLSPATMLGIPATCDADLDRLAALVPRIALGYHRLDATGFSGSMVAELALPAAVMLRRLRTAVPEVTRRPPAGALASFGIAVDGDQAIAVAQEVAQLIAAQPFRCGALGALNQNAADAAAALAKPLPPMVHGLRGGMFVLQSATTNPTSFTGHALVAGDHVDDLITLLMARLGLGRSALSTLGVPVELPVAALHVPGLTSAHLVATGDRAAIAFGADSANAVLDPAQAPVPTHSPFLTLSYDVPTLRAVLPSIATAFASMDTFGNVMMRLDLRDDCLSFDIEDADMPTVH